jgi:hypothetical protein
VTILRPPGRAIGLGQQTIVGTGGDGSGSGVVLVEVSEDGLSWQPAEDTVLWSKTITVTANRNSTLDIFARATDFHGQLSEVVSATFVIDTVAPIITPTVPALVGGSATTRLTGVASDPAPVDALVADVEIQIDGGDWNTVDLNVADSNGERDWFYSWALPAEDGVQHTIRYRATDYAGNVITSTTPYVTIVDTVAPALGVTAYITSVAVGEPTPVLTGALSDGSGFATLTVIAYPDSGPGIELVPVLDNGSWSVAVESLALGNYTLILIAADAAGNETDPLPFAVAIEPLVPTHVGIAQMAVTSQAIWVPLLTLLGLAWVSVRLLHRRMEA